VLFIRAALAKADAGTNPGDDAGGSGSGSGSGSSMTSVEPITAGSGAQTAPTITPGSGTGATTSLRPPTGTSGGTLRPPTGGSGGVLHPPTGSGSGSGTTATSGTGTGTGTTGTGTGTTGTGAGTGTGTGTGSTIDPYPPDAAPPGDDDTTAADLATQVNRLSSRSQSKFDHCYVTATKSLPPEQALTGDIDIAFQILGTGEIRNAAVVSDTTGSAELGRCLLAVISTWQFTASGGGPTDFVRPFHFSGH
jgi:TonB family protein